MIEMTEWSGPKPNDDLLRGLGHGHDGPSSLWRNKTRWLIDEGLLCAVSHDQMREGYLKSSNWELHWGRAKCPLGIRVGLGPIYGCDARDFIEMLRKYSNDGATAQIVQLTGLAEALLDPRITSMEPIFEADDQLESVRYAKRLNSSSWRSSNWSWLLPITASRRILVTWAATAMMENMGWSFFTMNTDLTGLAVVHEVSRQLAFGPRMPRPQPRNDL